VRFRCIRAHENQFAIRMMCRVVDVSVSGYYRWRDRAPAARAVQDAALLERLREHHRVSRQTYGRLRLRAALRNDGVRVSAKRVRRLMKLGGITVGNGAVDLNP
jgi:putative transposase